MERITLYFASALIATGAIVAGCGDTVGPPIHELNLPEGGEVRLEIIESGTETRARLTSFFVTEHDLLNKPDRPSAGGCNFLARDGLWPTHQPLNPVYANAGDLTIRGGNPMTVLSPSTDVTDFLARTHSTGYKWITETTDDALGLVPPNSVFNADFANGAGWEIFMPGDYSITPPIPGTVTLTRGTDFEVTWEMDAPQKRTNDLFGLVFFSFAGSAQILCFEELDGATGPWSMTVPSAVVDALPETGGTIIHGTIQHSLENRDGRFFDALGMYCKVGSFAFPTP